MGSIIPTILCGGSGKRLWPLSRKSYPKQFVSIVNGQSLFQTTLTRFSGEGFAPPVLLTGDDFKFIVNEQAEAAGVTENITLIEPTGRNTAPAILAAAAWVAERDPDATMLILPSDHLNHDDDAFLDAVKVAAKAAQEGAILTFGTEPTYPATGFGYIELAEPRVEGKNGALKFNRFVEKPSRDRASEMIASGQYLWNSGTFCFSARTAIEAFKAHSPELLKPVKAAISETEERGGFHYLGDSYCDARDVSVDYAVMEHISNGKVVPINTGWNDLGSWKTVWQESHPDENGVAMTDNAVAIDCEQTLLRSEHEGMSLVGIGLNNIVAVAMQDAVLVADMDRAQDVKVAVQKLSDRGAIQAEEFPRYYRPWGWFESLVQSDRYQVKQIMVKPGGRLSLQSHNHRAEHWVVVSGTAKVTLDQEEQLLSENQSIYVPLGTIHRLENPGKVDLRIIEVQTGSYLGEDDIIRYEDIYSRT